MRTGTTLCLRRTHTQTGTVQSLLQQYCRRHVSLRYSGVRGPSMCHSNYLVVVTLLNLRGYRAAGGALYNVVSKVVALRRYVLSFLVNLEISASTVAIYSHYCHLIITNMEGQVPLYRSWDTSACSLRAAVHRRPLGVN